ncbi:LIM-domain binding protein-domain-containing protein, partial [Scleroderma citrinum]
IGFGQGCIRLSQFSSQLESETTSKYKVSFWNTLIREYFTQNAIMKIALWEDNKKVKGKPLQISVPILSYFFREMTQSGIKSMSLSFDGARERLSSQNCAVVECDSAVWTHNYTSGSTVTLRGPLTVHVRICPHANQTPTRSQRLAWSLKFYHFQFSSFIHEKFYTTPSPNRVLSQQRAEEEGIWENPFGIPQAALRCLEVRPQHLIHDITC